eukprot:3312072-Rhodomonas_salina.2
MSASSVFQNPSPMDTCAPKSRRNTVQGKECAVFLCAVEGPAVCFQPSLSNTRFIAGCVLDMTLLPPVAAYAASALDTA